jgi:hypothetical protein
MTTRDTGGDTATHPTHGRRCAENLRLRLLLEAGEPAEPGVALRRALVRQIAACCGHSALKSHRLAWGWTVEQAVGAFHAMCRDQRLGARGLSQRSWLGWEAGGQPNDDYRDLLCRLFQTGPVELGFARDYTPSAPAVSSEPQASLALARGGSPTDRRQAIKLGGQATLGVAVGAGLSDTFTGAVVDVMEFTRRAEASSLGPRTLEHLELAVMGMAAAFAHTPAASARARWRLLCRFRGWV